MNRKGLGRGLDALLAGDYQSSSGESVTELALADIVPNRFQPRREFDAERLAELAESIKRYGVLQPIVCRRQNQGYELIAGERRWRASQLAGLAVVPALIREYTDAEMTAVALVENLPRENLNPMEEALAYRRLMDEFDLTQEEISLQVGKSRSFIANSVRLLNLPPTVQEFVSRGTMSPGQARPLLVLPTPSLQEEAAAEIIKHALTAREAEELARQRTRKPLRRPPAASRETPPDGAQALADQFSAALGTRVKIQAKDADCGVILIEYYSPEELQRLLEQITGEPDHDPAGRQSARRSAFPV